MQQQTIGLLSRAKQIFANIGSSSVPEPNEQGFALMWPQYRTGQIQWQVVDYESFVAEGYISNSVVHSAIAYKYRASASAPLTAFLASGGGFDFAPPGHPLTALAERPNPVQTGIELVQASIVYLNLHGNCFIVIIRDGDGIPVRMYTLRPDRVFIVPTVPGEVMYVYHPEGTPFDEDHILPILPEDMIHVKFPNPLDELEGLGYGMSPIWPMSRAIDVDNRFSEFLYEFVRRGAVLPGILSTDQPLSQDDAQKIRDTWQKKHGGTDQWPEIAVLEKGLKYQVVAMPFDQMGFDKIDERNESRMLGPFGVPPILIGTRTGLQRSTYSNYREARRGFWEDTMEPELRQFGGEFKARAKTADGAFINFYFARVPTFVERNMERAQTFVDLFDRGIPRRQSIEVSGLPLIATPHDDISFMPNNMVTAEQLIEGETVAVQPALSETASRPEEETPSRPLTANQKKIFRNVLRIIDDEKEYCLRDRRSFSWEEVRKEWVIAVELYPDRGQLRKLLVKLSQTAETNGWNGDQVKKQLTTIFGQR